MIIDAQTRFSNAQAITSTAASTNLIDLGAIRNLGVGQNLYVVVQVTTAMADSSSNSTIAVTTETDDNAGFTNATTGQTIGTFAAVSAVGTTIVGQLYPDRANERYLRLKYTPANGNLSAGAFTAFLTPDIQNWQAYAKGYTGPRTT